MVGLCSSRSGFIFWKGGRASILLRPREGGGDDATVVKVGMGGMGDGERKCGVRGE